MTSTEQSAAIEGGTLPGRGGVVVVVVLVIVVVVEVAAGTSGSAIFPAAISDFPKELTNAGEGGLCPAQIADENASH